MRQTERQTAQDPTHNPTPRTSDPNFWIGVVLIGAIIVSLATVVVMVWSAMRG